MMGKARKKKFETLKLTVYSTFLTLVLLGSSMNVLQAALDERPEMLPIVTVAPQYPRTAIAQGIEGWVVLQFTVDKAGNVVDPFVVASCIGGEPPQRGDINKAFENAESSNCNTAIFDLASITAVEKFKFEPRMVNSDYVDVPDVRYLFRYKLRK